MRARELERIQRVKAAQKRLEEIRQHSEAGRVTKLKNGELTTFIPFTEWSEVHRLELLISRNQRWLTKPRKPKKPKATPMPATPAETALYTDEMHQFDFETRKMLFCQ